MSIDPNRWIGTLPTVNAKTNQEKYESNDSNKLVDASPQQNKNKSITKYSLTIILFILGLIFVSTIKNETRNLQKEINNLKASINSLELDLHWATLDYAVITSPENISRLAKEYLNTDFISYKKSQLRQLYGDTEIISKLNKKNNNILTARLNKKNNYLSTKIKLVIKKKIEKKKTEIRKLQQLYSKPTSIPAEVKTQIASKIKEKKIELKNLYSSPKKTITLEKARSWTIIQIAKLFLGIPTVPWK